MTNHKKRSQQLADYGALIALVFLVLALSIFSKDFRSLSNLISLVRQSTVNGFIAFGMTLVILTGGIDLSVGSVLSLTTAISAGLIVSGLPVPLAFLIGLALGTGLGLVSGVLVTKGRLQPFIATLVTMTVYRGLTFIYMGGRPISNLGDSFFLQFFGRGAIFKIPFPVLVFALIFGLLWFLLNQTALGRRIYGTGSNEITAILSGVRTDRVKIKVYALSGFLSSLAGLVLLSRLGSAQTTLGTGYELDAIAAVVLGGTSMAGGRGRISGTLIGVLIIAVLNNGLNILGVSSYYQDVVKGIVILIAVLADRQKNH